MMNNIFRFVYIIHTFCIHSQKGLSFSYTLHFLTKTSSIKQVQHYLLVVQAQDNGHPSLSTTLTVYCNVLDLNDNAPIFDPMSYANEVLESVPIGTEVVTVSASDADSGEFQRERESVL